MKNFKGKKIEKSNYKNGNVEYDGFIDVDSGKPHGKGICIVRRKDNTIGGIEDGIFQNGFLIEGSETTYHLNSDRNCIIKEIGKWRFDNDKNFCEEYISGKGEELYYRSEKDLKDNKYFGYVKGTFDNGKLLKGEVYNASLIKYSDEDFVKKIIVKKKSKNFLNPDTKYRQNLMIGEIFFENGDHYEGELWHDQPIGLGTMTYKDGSKDSGSFGGDGIFEGKKN
ncbi:hypothetical protein OAR77_01715 [Candidatus Pelagibacter sp.]|nr:hypothetical protein [Candidatus Pelagibacter sp.]